MKIEIGTKGESCDCPGDFCKDGRIDCIRRFPDLEVLRCAKHEGPTWHSSGKCIGCEEDAKVQAKEAATRRHEELLRGSSEAERPPVKRMVAGSTPAPAAKPLRLVLYINGTPITWTDQEVIAGFLKVALGAD